MIINADVSCDCPYFVFAVQRYGRSCTRQNHIIVCMSQIIFLHVPNRIFNQNLFLCYMKCYKNGIKKASITKQLRLIIDAIKLIIHKADRL